MANILVTGGAGYVGHVLVPRLLDEGHFVTVYDTLYFGCRLPNHRWLRVVKGDIRDTRRLKDHLLGQDVVIHLACISNDASVELDPRLSETTNYDCFEPMVIAAKNLGVSRFIFASSGSVYGVSDAPNVTEDHPLVPLSLYNIFKGKCEPLLLKHAAPDFTCTIIRPATICGYSPRCRMDLSVNLLTNQAINAGKITVFGGDQMRPNLHIEDMVDVYLLMLTAPHEKIHGEIFNVGYENLSIREIARTVKNIVDPSLEVVTTPSDDNRSYRLNSDKIERVLNFRPKFGITNGITHLVRAFGNHLLPDSIENDWYYNVRTMKKLGVINHA